MVVDVTMCIKCWDPMSITPAGGAVGGFLLNGWSTNGHKSISALVDSAKKCKKTKTKDMIPLCYVTHFTSKLTVSYAVDPMLPQKKRTSVLFVCKILFCKVPRDQC